MRKLDFSANEQEKYFENDLKNGILKPIITYVKNNKDVFLGIRNKEVILYSAGAKILDIKYNDKNQYEFSFDKNHYQSTIPTEIQKLPSKISTENDVQKWISCLDKIKYACVKFNYKHDTRKRHKKDNSIVQYSNKEKIIQQALLEKINNSDSDYFCYDIEYVFKENNIEIPFGRADNMIITCPKNNTIKLYLFEMKNSSNAISGVKAQQNGAIKSFGSGVVGHVYNYMRLLELIYDKNKEYKDIKNNKTLTSPQVYNHFLEEIKYAMKLYNSLGLINNKKFKEIKNWDSIDKLDAELVFYITNITSDESFKNHLGIGNKNSDYNVKYFKKVEKKSLKEGKYDVKLRDFKYFIDSQKFDVDFENRKEIDNHVFDIDIENYPEIKKEDLLS